MDYLVIHRTHNRAKHLSIRINQRGEIVVTRPPSTSQKKAETLLRESRHWLDKQLKKIGESTASYGLKAQKLMLQGDLYQLITIRAETKKQENIQVRPFILELHTLNDAQFHQSAQLKTWMQAQARLQFIPLVHYWATQTGWKPAKIRVTTMSSRWGSCSPTRNININALLYQAPPKTVEYVIIHELAHLAHPNHSQQFWQAVAQYCPNYQAQRRWLRHHNRQLLGW